MRAAVLTPRGPFSLAASLRFLEGFTPAPYGQGHEPVLHAAVTAAYGLEGEAACTPGPVRIAERWKPYRSWVAFLLRAHTDPRVSGHGHGFHASG
ncbi:hypothetical protein AMK16_00520 [Streptomyces sp. CB00455]|uniref:hypothetical protein n=1 Tax=Streptomyces sp. CB00455 TaxID=1703927 RepID=UPI00093DD532|nr:hypothetical protein [Streptomyces sp. CB00455]OKK21809.1 hypothetical protein AMK16_00520 [Streptomyces sp. CB00455]